jgi:hypothetical protein
MAFYRIGDNTIFARKWLWAWNMKPHTEEMSVLCNVCHRGRLFPESYPRRSLEAQVGPLDAQSEGDFSYPDVLGSASPYLIVSGAVIDDWENSGVTGYQKYPIYVSQAFASCRTEAAPLQYYHIEVTGRCQLNTEASGIRIVYKCPLCGYIEEDLVDEDPVENPFASFPFIFREDTWDGSDLFVSHLFDRVYFCSQKIFDLARQNKRTNFRFVLPEDMDKNGDKAIDYMAEI